MAVQLTCATSIILACGIIQIQAISWLNTPGTVRACANGNATFLWHYDITSTRPVTFYQWQYVSKGITILQNNIRPNSDNTLTYYPPYDRDRVDLADPGVANAGIILRKLAKSDEGQYLVRVTGGVTNTASLEVYTENQLEPTLEINNSPVEFGSTYNMSECTRCVIVVGTTQALTADITISTSIPSTPIECKSKTTCSKLINLAGAQQGANRITFNLDYGFCSVKERFIDVVWVGDNTTGDDPVESEPHDGSEGGVLTLKWEFVLGLTLAVLVVIVIILCVIVCVLFKWVRRKQKCDEEQLSRRQRTLLGAANRWRSITKASNPKTILRSRSRTPKTELDVSDAELGFRMVNTTTAIPADNKQTDDGFPNRDSPEGKDIADPMIEVSPGENRAEYHPARGEGDGSFEETQAYSNGSNLHKKPVEVGEEACEDSNELTRQQSSDSVLNDFVVVQRK